MLVELSVIPLNGDTHLSDEIAQVVRRISESGLPYQLTPSGTCIEGEWDEVMRVIKECHQHMLERSPHVFTTIRIEDEPGAREKIVSNVASVEAKVGGHLRPVRAIASTGDEPEIEQLSAAAP